MFSIDQNCHSLWDALAKLQCLAGRRVPARHFIEDIDAAFTDLGSRVDDPRLRLERERYHHSGGASWGAALFYTEFLGRQAVELRAWEPFTGLSTKALAHQLDRTEAELYDAYSPGDNWQLVGSSYAGDRQHHRVLGDLSVAETAPFIGELLGRAEADMRRAFPAAESQARVEAWFVREKELVARLLAQHAAGRLVELYAGWLGAHLPDGASVQLERASSLFALNGVPERHALLEVFVRDYARAAALFNEAVEETDIGLRKLKVSEGELPFFAGLERAGRLVRTGVHLRDGHIRVGEGSYPLAADGGLPLAALSEAGVRFLVGKAILLVLQARLGEGGQPLLLPYRGSYYMPAAHRLAAKLRAAGLLPGELKPLMRIRFRLLERMSTLDTPLRLPPYLAEAWGREVLPARTFAAEWAGRVAEARRRLEEFRTPAGRRDWQTRHGAPLWERMQALEAQRRERGLRDPKDPGLRALWREIRGCQSGLLKRLVEQIARDWQVRELDFYDSRGALLPWSVALGGKAFCREVLERAEIYAEPEEDVRP